MTFTISILIKSTIVLLLTTASVLALKKSSASLRHLVISLGLLGLLLLPVFQYFAPAIEVEMPIIEQLELETLPLIWNEEVTTIISKEFVEKESSEFIQQEIYVPVVEADLPIQKPQKGVSFFQFNMDLKEVLFWIWALGCVLFSMRILMQMIRVWGIRRKSQAISIDLADLDLKLRRSVQFLSNATIKTPMTFGLFRPKILLPTDAQNWSAEQLKIVVLHELAHIKRHDYLLHLIGLLALNLLWFHPLVWLLQKWQQSEREKACDEYVLKQGISKTNYAESLVNIARNMLINKAHRWHSSLPMAANSETKKRVLAILKFDLQQWQFTPWMQWRWIGFFACVLPYLAAIHPATKEFMEESMPKIEAVLEQPVFVPKVIEEEIEIVSTPTFKTEVDQSKSLFQDAAIAELSSLPTPKVIPQNPILPSLPKQNFMVKREAEDILLFKESHEELNGQETEVFYGRLEEHDKIIEIWAKGDFNLQNSFPYFINISPEAEIVIQKKEKAKGKKYYRKVFIQQLPFNGKLTKKGHRDGIPIRAGEHVHTYVEGSGKIIYTVTTSPYGGFKFSDKKKDYREIQQDWNDIGIMNLVNKIQADSNFLKVIQKNDRNWEQMTNPDAGVLGLGHIFPTSKQEWQKVIQEYEIEQTGYKEKNKEQPNQVQVPESYVYIPSGKLKSAAKGGGEEKTIQGFHMSETEITNQQYREFLRAMERRGKIDLLKKARIYNENWVRNYHYNEPMYNEPFANTYHVHPAFNKYPVVNISYEGAQAYCQWMTELYNEVNKNSAWQVEFRLPSKEEWMYAAKGGHKSGYYPWGGHYVRNSKGCYLGNFKQIDESKLIFNSKNNTFAMADSSITMTGQSINGDYQYIDGQGLVIADGYFPNNYGLYNMSGNAAEMLQEKGTTKGGSWNSTGYHVRIDAADEYAGWEEPNPYIGFRPIVMVRKK